MSQRLSFSNYELRKGAYLPLDDRYRSSTTAEIGTSPTLLQPQQRHHAKVSVDFPEHRAQHSALRVSEDAAGDGCVILP